MSCTVVVKAQSYYLMCLVKCLLISNLITINLIANMIYFVQHSDARLLYAVILTARLKYITMYANSSHLSRLIFSNPGHNLHLTTLPLDSY